LLFLPAEARAALDDLGNLVYAKIARLKQGASLETTRFMQSQFIKWCNQKLIPDPCGNEPGYELIFACFAENLMFDCNFCSATVQEYIESINKLFALRSFPIPADLKDKDNMVAKLIHARKREENIAKQHSPLTKEMYVEMAKCAEASPRDSVDSVLFDFFNLIRVGGFRVAEYAQKTQIKADEYEYPSGSKVIKAFTSLDWRFYDATGCLITLHSLDGLAKAPKKLQITFRIQKICKNGQKITFTADYKHPHICPVCSAYCIFLQAKQLGQADDQPMGVYLNHQDIVKYLTGNKIAELLQSIAKHCHPDLTRDKISRFSSHSGRVWAVVLLDEARINSDFIKS
jgi:hypothetical protein